MHKSTVGKRTQWKQWAAGITATISMVCAGTVYGWATTNLSRLMDKDSHIVITSDQSSWIVSLTGIGSMIGPFIGAACADTFGRKRTLLLTSLIYGVGWLIDIFATKVEELYVARVILGTGIGISYTTNPMYVSEIADVNIRGALGTLIAVNVFTGSVFTCSLGPFVAIRTLSIVLFLVPVLFLCLFAWFPETPYFLASKKRYVEASKSLSFFKGISDNQEAKDELEAVILSVEKNSTTQKWTIKFREMLLPNNRKAVTIIVSLIIAQLMSGNYTTMAYLEVLFQSANIGIDTNLATVIVLVMGLLSCALATVTVEKFGCRPLLMTSTLGASVTLAVLASYLIADRNGFDVTSVNWLPVVVIVLFQLVYQLGLGAIPDALIGQLFPNNVKSIGSAIVTISDGVFGLVVSKLYQVIGDAVGEYVVYYIFSAACFLAFLFSFIFIPETKNKEFEEIQQDLAVSRLRCFRR
ncbi:facilitated trehalose transporter Tret1-like [Diprion similis]|uniref:facilitated trehalose transporter Tret1-like n=1 Tax=Diprion similis TaxID=362088 RepID=UPI001EF88204|nr:facilitated trehalose transporter Tret1-like [Diprion similis]